MDTGTIILIVVCIIAGGVAGIILGAIWVCVSILNLLIEGWAYSYGYINVHGKPTYIYSISDKRRWVWRAPWS